MDRWWSLWIVVPLAIGLFSAGVMSYLYTLSGMPEAHVQGHHLTLAGQVHLVYMAIAVAVFIQFLFFTDEISPGLLGLVSILLLIHVFVGTHMLLGIIKLNYPLKWFPAQPLGSYFGWITFGAVAIGLAERNFGLGIILWFVDLKYPEKDEDYLKLLDFICKVVNRGYFTFVAGLALGRGDSYWSIVLIIMLGLVYYLSRLSVWQELGIGRTLYPPDPHRVPSELQMKERAKITLEVLIFMLAYVAAAWTAHCILAVSLLMLVIACIDFNTRREINQKTRKYFADQKYSPHVGEADFKGIMDRRTKAERFLFDRPHLRKEAMRIAGFASAFAIANFAYFSNVQNVSFGKYLMDAFYCAVYRTADGTNKLAILGYIVMILTLVINECVTLHWRVVRDIDFGRLKINESLLAFFAKQKDSLLP